MNREINIRLNANREKAVTTGYKFVSGDKGIIFKIAVDGIDTTGTTAKIVFKRCNGTSVEANVTGKDNVYTYKTLGNEFEVVGLVLADVKFYENANRISTCTFTFEVASDTMDGIGAGTAGYSDTLERLTESAVNTEKTMMHLNEELQRLYKEYYEAFGSTGVINPRGTYSGTTAYNTRDVVFFNNTTWICRKSCTGATPRLESDYWQKFETITGNYRIGIENGLVYVEEVA